MSEPLSSLSMIDRAKRWMKLLRKGSRSSPIGPEEKRVAAMFSNAHDFAINGGQFINELKVNYINDVVSNRQAVFKLLEPYACLDATKDSSARYPAPKCHPQTRMKIRERLSRWLSDVEAEQKMVWVRGSAGTGKSAVAQSLGDSCEEDGNLGGSYFFSRVANRNKLETVVPTLICQLVTNVPAYRSLIGHRLAENPLLLRNSPPVQFRRLIVEPFAALQRQGHRKPIAIILDGLDECEGEAAQLEIIEMITNAVSSNPDLPLRWLIFSRSEAHLKNTFSTNTLCGREELVIDADCWEDVERYTKDRLAKIKNAYKDVTPTDWPSQNQLEQLLDAVSGLFILAETCLNFIANPEGVDPPSRLSSLLNFMRRSQDIVSRNPLAALDLLYSQILEKIPSTVFETTRQILGYICHRNRLDEYDVFKSAQQLSNFFRLDQHMFYTAVRGLHSVMNIPEPEDAATFQIQFYHASFHDFLLDPNRSSKFSISEQDGLLDVIQFSIYWCEVDATHFHTDDGWNFDWEHKHDSLPGLTWVSEDDRLSISKSITRFIHDDFSKLHGNLKLDMVNDGLLSQLYDLNFRYWDCCAVLRFVRLCQLDPSTSIMRIEPSSPTDHQLMDYFKLVIGNRIANPATSPPRLFSPDGQCIGEYFLIGHGVKSVVVWTAMDPGSISAVYSLRADQEPSEAQISEHADYLKRWDEKSSEELLAEYEAHLKYVEWEEQEAELGID